MYMRFGYLFKSLLHRSEIWLLGAYDVRSPYRVMQDIGFHVRIRRRHAGFVSTCKWWFRSCSENILTSDVMPWTSFLPRNVRHCVWRSWSRMSLRLGYSSLRTLSTLRRILIATEDFIPSEVTFASESIINLTTFPQLLLLRSEVTDPASILPKKTCPSEGSQVPWPTAQLMWSQFQTPELATPEHPNLPIIRRCLIWKTKLLNYQFFKKDHASKNYPSLLIINPYPIFLLILTSVVS